MRIPFLLHTVFFGFLLQEQKLQLAQTSYINGLAAQIEQHVPKVKVEHSCKVVPLKALAVTEERVGEEFAGSKHQQKVESSSIRIGTAADKPAQRLLQQPEQYRRDAPNYAVEQLARYNVREDGASEHVEECVCCIVSATYCIPLRTPP